jgi:hypothetical protein
MRSHGKDSSSRQRWCDIRGIGRQVLARINELVEGPAYSPMLNIRRPDITGSANWHLLTLYVHVDDNNQMTSID